MKPPNPLEKDIEKAVCDYAKSLGILSYKFTSPARRSVPDRIFIMPGGRAFMIEFKRKGAVPTPAQAVEIAKLRKQGFSVHVIDSKESGRCTVSHLLKHVMIFTPVEPQQIFIDHLAQHDNVLGYIGMGIGKTAACLHQLDELFHNGESIGALVVAPKRVANLTWPAEIRDWDQFRWMRVANLREENGSTGFPQQPGTRVPH